MGCPFRTPAGALEAVRACLAGVFTPTPEVVLGPQGVGLLYGCCDDGLLTIEWLDTLPMSPTTGNTGGQNCFDDVSAGIKITLSRCVQTFDTGKTGNAVPVATRNAAAQVILAEAFAMLEALLCCIRSEAWEDCEVKFVRQDSRPPLGKCWSHSLLLRVDLLTCCS